MEKKSWYKSKTMQGAILFVISWVSQRFGLGIDEAGSNEIINAVYSGIDAVSLLWGAWGARNAMADGSKPLSIK